MQAYHCIKKMKLDWYNNTWLVEHTSDSPTGYYTKV
jgi:hypothetical protein